MLYAGRALFVRDDAAPPRWRLAEATSHRPAITVARAAPASRGRYAGREPREWQHEALAAWIANGRRGVVQAVTGTGKTTVGILAAAAAVDAGERVLVLVPGTELLQQWYDVIRRDLPALRVGRLGCGHRDSLSNHHIVVAVVNSAAVDPVLPGGLSGLIVADEVHRYGAPFFAQALDDAFTARLGLTATYTREDDLLERNLVPYFGPVVAGCSYLRGLADGILAPFRVGFVGTDFTAAERQRHDQCESRMKSFRNRLTFEHGCPPEPFGEFMSAVNRLAQGGGHAATRDARGYLQAFSRRRQLLAECERKYRLLAEVAPAVATVGRGLVFGESKACAEQSAEVLTDRGVPTMSMTSDLSQAERRKRLTAFKDGRVTMLAAPRILDEGIDVPEADLGIIMAASRSKRQMIQRMGRVIRPKSDGRPAAFVVVYVRGTAEDPSNGAHEDFRAELTEVAQEIKYFSRIRYAAELLEWLQPPQPLAA
ncbi:DEAD/DEAH box helicase [Actinoplanes sp. NPDC026623]|uniref:DEAD/DEAH box helicase n=1 Tax=Actinoplanes sp. NPDC026623 TaxID=3155610 RepID=UPI0033F6C3B2